MTATIAPTRVVSDRKRTANQANAKRSTGPKTPEGKAKVSLNAVTHGLRAETVVLPFENRDEFEAMRQGWFEDWKPQTATRLALVERAVAGAWRLRRCVKVEHDRIADKINAAVEAYEERTLAWVKEGARLFVTNPARGVEILESDPRGVEGLIKLWEGLARAADDPRGWSDPDKHHVRLLNALGFLSDTDPDAVGSVAVASLRLLVWNAPDSGECLEPITDIEEANELAAYLSEFSTEMAASMRQRLSGFPDPDLVRARVADSVAYDVSPEGVALQRYEGQLDRSFRANLNHLMKLAQTGADLIEAEASDESEAPIKATETPAEPPIKATEPRSEAPNEPTEAPIEPDGPIKATVFGPYEENEAFRAATANAIATFQERGY